MAYLPTSQRTSVQQEQDQNQVQPQAAALPSSSASGSAAPAPSAPYAQSAAGSPQAAQPSASYPMITDYLRANEGAGKSMSADVSNRVGSEATGAKQQADKAQADWTSQNQSAIDQWRQATNNAYSTDVQQLADLKARADRDFQGGVSQMYTATNPQDRQAFLDRWYQEYRGKYVPTEVAAPNLSTYYTPSSITSAQADVNSALNALGTDSGRSALMSQRYGGRAPYTGGASALDAALVGRANPETNLRAQYGDIINALTAGPAPLTAQAPEAPWQLTARWGLPDPVNGNYDGIYRNG